MSGNVNSNMAAALAAWGGDPPRWIVLLASACDTTNQRAVAERLRKSNGYVSRLINNHYAGSLTEAEGLIRATYGDDDVVCPIWGAIPLESCRRERRRRELPVNAAQRLHRATCPTCPNNTDRQADHTTSEGAQP